jgi:hypothetical protein
MDNFDIDLKDIGGTEINNLAQSPPRNYVQNQPYVHQPLEISQNQPTENIDNKKKVNMNNFIRNLESDLKKYSSSSDNIENHIDNKPIIKTNHNLKAQNNTVKNDIIEILIYILIFMILNNKFIIDLIFNFVPYMNSFNNTYLNLLIRSVIFGLLVFIYKKYYSNN